MTEEEIIKKLENDEDYYGEFGQQFLSNSNISTLLKDPLALHQPSKITPAFLVGGYFHTAILEPNKLKSFRVIKAPNRNTKEYKEMSEGELCLLEHEVDIINLMTNKILENNVCRELIRGTNIIYEKPGVKEIYGEMWKGKADIINHDERLVIDLKTTADIKTFRNSANRYNYDSQAFIYQELFGYEMLFIIIDKSTHRIKICDCSSSFYERGRDKVSEAIAEYRLHFKNKEFDPKQYFETETL